MKIGVYFEGSPKMGGGFFQSLQSCLLLNEIKEYKSQFEFITTNVEAKNYLKNNNLKSKIYKKSKIFEYYSKLFEIDLIKEILNKFKLQHPFSKYLKKNQYDLVIFLGPSMLSMFWAPALISLLNLLQLDI